MRRPASTHHPGSPGATDWRSAPGSRTSPTAGPCAGRDAARSTQPPGPRQRTASGRSHSPRQAILHIAAQLQVARKLGGLRSPAAPIRVPLRGRCPIGQRRRCESSVAAQLPRDRRRRATDPPGDLAHPQLLSSQQTRSPPARRTTSNAPTAGQQRQMASRHPHGTIGHQQPPTRQPQPPPPRSRPHARSRVQNRTRCSRRPAVGRPGERSTGRPV